MSSDFIHRSSDFTNKSGDFTVCPVVREAVFGGNVGVIGPLGLLGDAWGCVGAMWPVLGDLGAS